MTHAQSAYTYCSMAGCCIINFSINRGNHLFDNFISSIRHLKHLLDYVMGLSNNDDINGQVSSLRRDMSKASGLSFSDGFQPKTARMTHVLDHSHATQENEAELTLLLYVNVYGIRKA